MKFILQCCPLVPFFWCSTFKIFVAKSYLSLLSSIVPGLQLAGTVPAIETFFFHSFISITVNSSLLIFLIAYALSLNKTVYVSCL